MGWIRRRGLPTGLPIYYKFPIYAYPHLHPLIWVALLSRHLGFGDGTGSSRGGDTGRGGGGGCGRGDEAGDSLDRPPGEMLEGEKTDWDKTHGRLKNSVDIEFQAFLSCYLDLHDQTSS